MIELRGAAKRFGETEALLPTQLAIEKGQTVALIGPSGCGKSTLLRLIVGLVHPSEGSILIDGRMVEPASAISLRRRMGYVIQDGGLFPHLTTEQNASLLARHLGRDAAWTANRVKELADLTRLPTECLPRYPAELSGGQRQRVSLMRALMLDPDLLLLDEPLAALDPMIRASLQADLKEIFARLGKTVVLVTHDMAEAGFLADRIVLMKAGRVVQDGTLVDLRERPAEPFVTEFMSAQRSLVSL